MLLKIKSNNEMIKNLYNNHDTYHTGDSGLDLYVPETITIKANSLATTINMGISCEAFSISYIDYFNDLKKKMIIDDIEKTISDLSIKEKNCSYYLYPRSSISNTPLRMSNSTGIIDAGYRGNIIAKVDNLSDKDYLVEKGVRLFQICSPTLEPISLKLVDELNDSSRGSSGFGSTSN